MAAFSNNFTTSQIYGMVHFMRDHSPIPPKHKKTNTNMARGMDMHLNVWHTGIWMRELVYVNVHMWYLCNGHAWI